MVDDDPVAFDESVQAVIERHKKLVAEKSAPPPATRAELESPPRAQRDTLPPVESGPSVEALEGWGITRADAELLRGQSRTTPFGETDALGYAREFLAEATRGMVKIMVLTGARGVGKTVAASWTMVVAKPELGGKSWPTDRHPVLIAASKIAMWGSYGFAAEREQLSRCKVLVIDELGIEDDTRGFRPYLNELLNQRAGAAGYTVITCNLGMPEFAARYGPRIMDRLRQRGAWFEIDHLSLRAR